MVGVRISDMPDLGVVDDTSSVVGVRGSSGRFSAGALRTYLLAGQPALLAVETAARVAADLLLAPATSLATETTARVAADLLLAPATSLAAETAARIAADLLLAPKASPTFTGTPAAPTATAGSNTTQIATTAFVTGSQTVTATGGTVARSLAAHFGDARSVKDFGAVGNGSTDDTVAIQAAITAMGATGGIVFFPPGTYKTSATLNIAASGITLAGSGKLSTSIKSSSTSLPVIAIGGFLTGTVIRDMTVDRSVTAIAGASGITASISTQFSKLIDLIVQHQWTGVLLGPTGYSLVENCIATGNLSAGFLVQNTAANGAVQWSFFNCLAAQNDGPGFLISAVPGPAAVALGEIVNCASFANSGPGFSAVGIPGAPIHGLRITGGFFGQDGSHGVFLNTYGGEHKLVGVFTELAGTGPTGTVLATAATNLGAGFAFTANNIDVQLEGCYAEGHSQSGYYSSAAEIMFNGCKSVSNGVAAASGDQNGFYILAGRAAFGNVRAGNIAGPTSQLYGIKINDGSSGHVICGADLTGNTTAYINVVANFTNTTIVGVVPGGNIVLPVGGFVGVANGSDAQPGMLGEYVNSTIAPGGPVAATSGVTANLTSISLTAGDWDVWGQVRTQGAATTITTIVYADVSTTSATLGANASQSWPNTGITAIAVGLPTGMVRISVATTTTVYLVFSVTFSASTLAAYGFLSARRVR